jgi:hypothetical protein
MPILHSLAEAKGNADVGIEVDFGPLAYDATSLQPTDPGQPELNVFLSAWTYGAGGPYVVLGKTDATVTLDGQTPVPPVDAWTCYDPQYHADAVPWPRSTATVTLTDATGSLEADFENLDAPRTFTITAPTGGPAHVGDTMTMLLSPGTDVFPVDGSDTAHYGLVEVDFVGPSQVPIAHAYATVHGASATVVVPQEAAGATTVQLIEEGTVGTTRCDVGHCDIVFDLATPKSPLAVTQ